MNFLASLLPTLGTIGGNLLFPGIGGAIGGAAGGIFGQLLGGGGMEDGSTDKGRVGDQNLQRQIAQNMLGGSPYEGKLQGLIGDILGNNANASIGLQGSTAMRDLSGQLASRGLGNSGVAGSAYGSLFAQLLGQRDADRFNRQQTAAGLYGNLEASRTNRMLGAAQVLQGVGERPQTQGEATMGGIGSLITAGAPLVTSLLQPGGLLNKPAGGAASGGPDFDVNRLLGRRPTQQYTNPFAPAGG
jgi:hypothetical protein